jgi:hypothetical protein
MRPTFGYPWTVVHTAARDTGWHRSRPARTLAGLVVALLAPVVAVLGLSSPVLGLVVALSTGVAALAGGWLTRR